MKLLIVDDEFFVRTRIIQQIDWDALGIAEVREASDGEEALKYLAGFRADLLLSDIRMPRMDGIRLAEAALQNNPECKIIFISGYSDTEYLKSAISLHVLGYVEKPIDMEELTQLLAEAAHAVRRERGLRDEFLELREKDRAERLERAALGLTRQDSLAGALLELEELINISTCKLFVTIILRLTHRRVPGGAAPAGDDSYSENGGEQIAEKFARLFERYGILCLRTQRRGLWIAHLLYGSGADIMAGYFQIEQCCHMLNHSINFDDLDVIYGAGVYVSDPAQIPVSYEHALLALQQGFFKQPGSLCYYKSGNNVYDFNAFDMAEFVHSLKKDKPESAEFLVRSVTSEIKFYDNTLIAHVARFYFAFAKELLAAAARVGAVAYEEFAWEQDIWEHMSRLLYIDELRDFIIDGIHCYYRSAALGATPNKTVNSIIRYIKQRYSDPDLSEAEIGRHVGLSTSYVSHLFKDVTGQTLVTYIMQTRINKSLDYISDPSRKIKDIAKLVGYRDSNYFSNQFKKHMGYPPREHIL